MVPAAKPVPCSTYATRDHGKCRSRVALCKEGIMEDYLLQGCINHIHGLEGFDHMRMTELEPGHCKVEIDTHQGLQNVYGNMHGGAIMVLVDMVSSTAAFACGKHVITLTSDTNFIKGLTFGNYPFLKSAGYSLFITIVSTALILLCTSMAAWYIARVDSKFCRMVYYLCIFSMVVPFQMVMFTLSKTADTLKLNTPWTIPIIYLGFGAGLAIFMFVGFVKSIPLEIEEAAAIDGCGPLRTYFSVVLPMLRPTMISVGILEIMWVWNDYLLPYLVLDRTKYMTIPIHIQYLKGSYGTVDLGATMALILLSIIPVIVFYLLCQKYIIKGVAAGAVKG